MEPDRDAILASLRNERTVDILTTGRRSGQTRTTEIWTTCVLDEVFIVGTPNAGRTDVDHQPRDWMANLLAEPAFVLRLTRGVEVDLAARATPVTDEGERRRILEQPISAFYRDAIGLEPAVANSPIVRVTFVDDAAWLNDAIASS